MNNSNIKVIISWVLLSTVFFAIVNSLETDDQFENTDRLGDSQGKREIIEIKIPRRHKRSVDSSISFPLRAFGRDINLNLQQKKGILFSSKTPVHFLKTRRSQTLLETKYNMFNSSILAKLYVDEDKKAAFTLRTDPTDGSTKIQYGFIGSENLVIDQVKPDTFLDSRTDITYNQDHYVATSIADEMSNAIFDIIGVGVNRRNPVAASRRIPETIYPEILIIVDYAVYNHFKEHGIIQYLIQFWNGVDLYYRPLQNPKFKLSIAGVIIAQDENVFEVLSPSSQWRGQGLIRYHSVLSRMSSWLQRARNSIPFHSYDTHIVMTPYPDGGRRPSGVIGLASLSSACRGITAGEPLGGTVYEPLNLQGILTAVHELGHVFGADHDEDGPCASRSIMAPYDSKSNEKWSQCSKNSFQRNLRYRDFTCMYNEPDLDSGNAGIDNNPPPPPLSPPVDTQIPHDPDHTDGQPPAVFHVEVTDDKDQLTVGLSEFSPDREVQIYYRNGKLVITQQNTNESPTATDSNTRNQDLHIQVPDYMSITLNRSKINPSKLIHIFHDNEYIYVVQGSQPVRGSNADSNVLHSPENNELNKRDLYFTDDRRTLCLSKKDLNLNKLVHVYCTNGRLYVSQRGVPDNKYVNNRSAPPNLDHTAYDYESFYICPTHIRPDKALCIQHADGFIYVRTRDIGYAS